MASRDFGENNINAGPLKEFKEICVDHFLGNDLQSTAFFLSHAHTDHMAGLETTEFLDRLSQPGIKLYCQLLTPMLVSDFRIRYLGGKDNVEKLIRSRKIVPLEIAKPQVLEIPSAPTNYEATITLLPAGHCPGSVMFLFEIGTKRILHTGDCRLSVENLKEMKHLHIGQLENPRVKTIDQLYVDTTFCTEAASKFPSRKTVLDTAIDHVRDWIGRGDNNWVKISFAANFAHEYILQELYRSFDRKVHVSQERYEIYDTIPGIKNSVTLNPITPFHLCASKDNCLVDKRLITLRLSSQWFTKMAEELREPVVMRGNTLSVCYAMHSSLTEIGEMIDYLRPRAVTPLVKPFGFEMEKIHDALRKICLWKFNYEDHRNNVYHNHDGTLPGPLLLGPESQLETMESGDSDHDFPPKKLARSNSMENSAWNFNFSPPSSKNSSKENSQEIQFKEPCTSYGTPIENIEEQRQIFIDNGADVEF